MKNYKRLRDLIPDGWSRDDYVITGSACLAVRGVRDVNDLDLLVRMLLWDATEELARTPQFDFFLNVPRLHYCDEIFEQADCFDGYNIISLRHCLAIKALVPRSRPKDVRDILSLATLIAEEEKHDENIHSGIEQGTRPGSVDDGADQGG